MASVKQNIAIVDLSKNVSKGELEAVALALQAQVSVDFAPIWDKDANVVVFPSIDEVSNDYWPITIENQLDVSGVQGYHWVDNKGKPYSKVKYREGWSLTASHELLEMLVNPYVNTTKVFKALDGSGKDVEYLVEVADPVEDAQFGYKVNGVLVSNFYYPSFFDLTTSPDKKYDHLGWLKEPRKLLNGGYISWRNATGEWFQAFMIENTLVFKKLGSQTPLTTAEKRTLFALIASFLGFVILVSSIVKLFNRIKKNGK